MPRVRFNTKNRTACCGL